MYSFDVAWQILCSYIVFKSWVKPYLPPPLWHITLYMHTNMCRCTYSIKCIQPAVACNRCFPACQSICFGLLWCRFKPQMRRKCFIYLNNTILCQMLSRWTKIWPYYINIWDTATHVVPLCSVYQAPSYEPSLMLLAPFPTELTYLSMLSILEVVCADHLKNEQHAQISELWQKPY